MKKRISIILCAAMLLTNGVYAHEADFDRKTGKITVSGQAGAGEAISVLAIDSEKAIASAEDIKANARLITEISADADGRYSEELNFGSEGGSFKILLNGESVKEAISVTTYSEEEIENALKELSTAAESGKSAVKTLLDDDKKNIAAILGIDELYKTAPEELSDEIANKKVFETIDDLTAVIAPVKDRTDCLKEINAMINKAQVKGLIKKMYAVLDESDDSYEKYIKMTNTDKVDESIFKAIPYTSLDAVKDKLKSAVSSGSGTSGSSSSGGGSSSGGSSSSNKGSTGTVFAPGATTSNANTSSSNGKFADVPGGHWAKAAIEYLAEKAVVSGDENNDFRPDDLVKREEFVKMLVCALGENISGETDDFADTDKNAWYSKYLAAAKAAGLIAGRDDGSFGIGETLTRQDMAVMIKNAVDKKGMTLTGGEIEFADSEEISDYAMESVTALAASGVVNGTGDNRFAPKASATRAQAAQIIYKLITTEGGI